MNTWLLRCIVCTLCLVIAGSWVLAEEGMWMLNEIEHLDLDTMKTRGLELSPGEITELSEAVVLIGGGTGAFVSNEGLILTNHHVAYGAIQRESTLGENAISCGPRWPGWRRPGT